MCRRRKALGGSFGGQAAGGECVGGSFARGQCPVPVALQLGRAGEPAFGLGAGAHVAALPPPVGHLAPGARRLGQHPRKLRAAAKLIEYVEPLAFVGAVGP